MVVLVKDNLFGDKLEKDNTSLDEGTKTKRTENEQDEQTANSVADNKEVEEKVPQYDGESPNKSDNLTGLVTYADVSGEDLIVRVNIDQFLQEGTCDLRIVRNGVDLYSESVDIQESVTTSTCDGFKIPVSELPKGELQIEISLLSGDRNGKISGRVKI